MEWKKGIELSIHSLLMNCTFCNGINESQFDFRMSAYVCACYRKLDDSVDPLNESLHNDLSRWVGWFKIGMVQFFLSPPPRPMFRVFASQLARRRICGCRR